MRKATMSTSRSTLFLRFVLTTVMVLAIAFLGLPTPSAGAEDDSADVLAEDSLIDAPLIEEPVTKEPVINEPNPGFDLGVLDPELDLDGELGLDGELELDPEAVLEAEMNAMMMAPLARPGEFIDGYWGDMTPAHNPPMPDKCGLDIALVFDLSNSIGKEGLKKSKEAGTAFIEGLKDTPTTLGLFSFATNAHPTFSRPSLNLGTDTGVADAKTAVEGMSLPTDDPGGTNWEAAFKQVVDNTQRYDVVYLITDGVPTTQVEKRPGGDQGRVTHNIDITRAITQANALKETGTRIEVISVNMPTGFQPVLKDNVSYAGDYATLQNLANFTWNNGSYELGSIPSYRFTQQERSGYSAAVSNRAMVRDGINWYLAGAEATASPTGSLYTARVGNISYRLPKYSFNMKYPRDISESVSGTGDVLALTDYSELTAELKRIAAGMCAGKVVIEKQIVDMNGEVIPDGEVKGWDFSASNLTGDPIKLTSPASATTDDDGRVEFSFEADLQNQTGTVDITESLDGQDGYSLHQQDRHNAVCRDSEGPVKVDNVDEAGFRVPLATDTTVTCVVQNKKDESTFSVSKSAQKDQQPDVEGEQSKTLINFDGTFTARYDITVKNETEFTSELRAPVIDNVTFPEGFDITKVKFYLDNKEITDVVRTDKGYEIPAAALGTFEANASKTIKVLVEGKADETAVRDVVSEDYALCEDPATETPRSLHNAVSLEGDEDESDNYACVDPEQPGITVTKDVQDDTGQVTEDGTRFITYTVTVNNTDGIDRDYKLIDTPGFADSVTIEYAEITGLDPELAAQKFEGAGPYTVVEKREIEAGDKHTYEVKVYFSGPTGDATQNQECSTEGAGHGLFNHVDLTSGVATDEDDACGPIPAPLEVSLQLQKVDDKDVPGPLTGAAFALHEVAAGGGLGARIDDLVESTNGIHAITLDVGKEYYIVETKSPEEYQLLPTPVKIKVTIEEGVQKLSILNSADAIGAEVGVTSEQNTVLLQIADVQIGALPKTGGMGVGVLAALAALIIGGGGWLLRKRSA